MNGDSLAINARNPVWIDGALAPCWFEKDGAALNLCSAQAAAVREVGLARSHGRADSLLLSLNWNAVGAVAAPDSGFLRLFSKAIAGTDADGERHWPAPSN